MELVQVAVPVDRLTEVYALLGSPKTASEDPAETSTSNGKTYKQWTEAALSQLLGEASETIQGEARYLAGHPDQEVTTEDVSKALKLPYGWNSLAGANGAWGRKLVNRGYDFPWSSRYASDGRLRMKMTTEIAAIVNKVI